MERGIDAGYVVLGCDEDAVCFVLRWIGSGFLLLMTPITEKIFVGITVIERAISQHRLQMSKRNVFLIHDRNLVGVTNFALSVTAA